MTRKPRLSVLFLTRYPVSGASSRYRVFQYLPYLEALGIDCTAQSFMDERMYRLALEPGRSIAKVASLVRAVFARLLTLRHWKRYDAIYLQRELLPFGPPIVERWLKRGGAKLLFDYDDALFIGKPSRFNPMASRFRMPNKTNELFRIVDCTIAGNDWLRDVARQNGGNSETFEVAEDASRFALRARDEGDVVTIGWLGSPSTVKYLKLIEGPLQRIAQRHPEVRWEIMGGGAFAMPDVPWRLKDWSYPGEVEALSRYDIGLMPLPDEEWALGKSGGKARTYMAASVVPVVAAIGYNRQLVDHGRTGFLCSSDSEWEQALERLIEDPELRHEIGKRARRHVETNFSPSGQAAKLAEIIRGVVSDESKRTW